MPEGVTGYPRWQGSLSGPPGFLVIAAEDIRRATRNVWSQVALLLAFAMPIVFLIQINSLADARGAAAAHTWANFSLLLAQLRWFALAVAAIMAGTALLDDHRRGALELYFARAIPRREYLAGKVLAVFGLTYGAFVGGAILYVLGTYLLIDTQPTGWERAVPGLLVYGLLWAGLAAGLGLGLSCVAKSGRGATLILFAGFGVADVFVASLLQGITNVPEAQLLSPFSAMAIQSGWLFGQPDVLAVDPMWGLVEVLVLIALGWGLVLWKQPRLAGEV